MERYTSTVHTYVHTHPCDVLFVLRIMLIILVFILCFIDGFFWVLRDNSAGAAEMECVLRKKKMMTGIYYVDGEHESRVRTLFLTRYATPKVPLPISLMMVYLSRCTSALSVTSRALTVSIIDCGGSISVNLFCLPLSFTSPDGEKASERSKARP